MAFKLTLAVVLLALSCSAQQLAGNYVDDYDYQDLPQRQPQRPPPQRAPQPQRSLPSAPIRQQSNLPRPTPVPILKQINRHNDDGSYTYGYEGADGTFKIETKFPTGDVKGKYGFVDDTGKVRVVEYGADRYGFQPAGEGITVAPPTLVDETIRDEDQPEDDGFYVERPRPRPQPQQRPRPSRPVQSQPPPPPPQRFQQDNYDVQTRYQSEPQYVPAPAPAPRPKSSPTPPRPLAIPGASPVSQGGFSAPPRPRPQPQQQATRAFQPAQQFGPQQFASRPAPPPQQAAPAHHQQQFAHVPQAAPHQSRSSGSGILDQLAKDYALPTGAGAPLHDISFGYY